MADKKIRMAQVGYGMFGADVVAGTMWDLQRNGISPYLDRVGLDDLAAKYVDVKFEMVAIGTRSEASALRAVAENEAATGKHPQAYHGDVPWDAIIADDPDIDLFVVATPDHLHIPPILSALRSGAHVVTEKPMCLKLDECEEVIELAARQNRIVGVDMHKRYDPDHLRIFNELRPEFGAPLYAKGVLEEPLEVSTQTFKWVEKSDPFTYVGIHWVDLFMHYLQLTPLSLYAMGQKKRLREEFGKDAFDSTQVMVTHTNGMTIVYENNWLTPGDFEGPVNQESAMLGSYGKVESDSQYRGLRYWVENKGSRTANTHFFRKVRRPDGSEVSMGYGKDSLIACIEKACRVKFDGVPAAALEGTYPDAASQRGPVSVVHGAFETLRRNAAYFDAGKAPIVTASFGSDGIVLHDPHTGASEVICRHAVGLQTTV